MHAALTMCFLAICLISTGHARSVDNVYLHFTLERQLYSLYISSTHRQRAIVFSVSTFNSPWPCKCVPCIFLEFTLDMRAEEESEEALEAGLRAHRQVQRDILMNTAHSGTLGNFIGKPWTPLHSLPSACMWAVHKCPICSTIFLPILA